MRNSIRALRRSAYPLNAQISIISTFRRYNRETYNFLKALELLVSKMEESRASFDVINRCLENKHLNFHKMLYEFSYQTFVTRSMQNMS